MKTIIIVGTSKENEFRRRNLLKNASRGMGEVVQKGENIHYSIGYEDIERFEYVLLSASLKSAELH